MLSQPVPLSTEEKIRVQAQLLNVVEQAILAVDLTGIVILWNRFAETLYGWSMEEVQGRNIEEILAAPQLMESVRANLEQLKNGKVWSGEFLVKHHNESTFKAQISASLIQNENSTLISIVSISCDSIENQQLLEANRLLAEAGELLSNAVDYEAPLTTLSELAVPQIADWCVVHLLQPDGSIEQVALTPAEIANLKTAYDWLQHDLPNDDANGLPAVLRSGDPKLVSDVSPELRAAAAAIKSYMIVPLIARPQILGAITFVASESGRRFDRNALALAENLASHIAIYLEKARLYHESQRLNTELEQRVNDRTYELSEAVTKLQQSETTVQTLFRISKELNTTLEVNTILDALAQEAIQIVDGESGFAGLRTTEGMTVRKYFLRGVPHPFEYTWPSGKGIPGWVLKNKVPYGTSDAAHDPVIMHELEFNANVHSVICTPILDSAGEVLGFFHILNKKGGEGFTIADQEMLMALAPVASIAIQNALAYQQRLATVSELKESSRQLQALAAGLELAREEERTQIARELHDQLGQALTAMKFDLAWLTDRLGKKDADLTQKAKNVTAQMDMMVKTVRRIATELRPGMLDDLGLAASIEWQARDFEKRTGIVCDVNIPTKDLLLPRAQSVALFRIFQETLTNIQRHASAHHIEVELTAKPDTLTLQVHDDGRGIQAKEIAGLKSLGLLGMRERAKQLGGSFDIQGVPGDGTIVRVSIPIQQKT
jgi:PAS domain S-box-containing protein